MFTIVILIKPPLYIGISVPVPINIKIIKRSIGRYLYNIIIYLLSNTANTTVIRMTNDCVCMFY